jgi:hypothetical protein
LKLCFVNHPLSCRRSTWQKARDNVDEDKWRFSKRS